MIGDSRLAIADWWGSGAALVLLTILSSGCQAPPAVDVSPAVEQAPTPIEPIDEGASPDDGDGILPAELNSARAAAMVVATLPPVADAATRVEIALHAALYRAAWETNIAVMTSHYLLEPPRDESGEADRPTPAVSDREFRLRVLAALARIGASIAFADQPATGDTEFFPGTRDQATRLNIRILSRDPAQATVLAEVGDSTAHVGSSRQRITAIWDGVEWVLQRDPARLVW